MSTDRMRNIAQHKIELNLENINWILFLTSELKTLLFMIFFSNLSKILNYINCITNKFL